MSDVSPATRLEGAATPRGKARPVSFFEFWPGFVFYAPVVVFWIAQAIRHRSLTLPALTNPRIEAGGICGESKNDILDLAGPEAQRWIAPYAGITTQAHPGGDLIMAEAAMAQANLTYPVVAKPDMSCNGTGVRLIETSDALARYLDAFPRATRLQLQALAPDEGEAGIFYIREPGATHGAITSITLKYAPVVVGDGTSRIRDLIAADDRLNAVSTLLLEKLGTDAARIPATGERVRLVFVGNHCRGSTFKDGRHLITPALTARIDAIARDIPDFHFGRFDLRYASANALRRGEGFTIIEVNGAGSEATHIWDPETSIIEAYRTQFFHYGAAFRIGATMRAKGVKRYGALRLLRAWRHQKALMARYPAND
ncbi:ATP-grasp domain-containing protein [Acidiphilium acidophilum]|uniref:D-alanine--D-alanine ligase n=1 Tax=Acidiphilium acidophilum TaxID=76588 RepID=A0AAW9DSM8_ACIAO|nr:D-alanine--D-alanine ligase [Acidiphilium acidophilum]MDX5932186.1 D-alanine--D-alanine ligase [Acidiphilium acidophilum]GBQ20454.1 D-alanine--D-alanine ligase [Acidiphilium acidophilum DSM 700]